ncbi:FkbM family methyltransferase [Protofrankia coriariae]|uniref:Methyltransferase FkbM domain-containing protein n=1 Tax=Protofrankia coriariae TaxID=1562887 RepID=A0ABR5F5C8_9ACTN|nr:FkbM family methyltransferase [Protofrankia coriariae]KLL11942.1 hypothetical protein FrCorBMG51_07960 [Protofrankia coriariae]
MRSGPLRWHLAAWVAARAPDVRGVDRVSGLIRGTAVFNGLLDGRLTNGLTFSVDDSRDGSVRALLALQYRPPALARVFEAALKPGDVCYDVGANIGVYALWSANLVGPTGSVQAFEPVPRTADLLDSLVRQNALSWVTVVRSAVGATVGEAGVQIYSDASGLAHITDAADPDITVPVTTLDTYVEDHPCPNFVKIDVEGHELDVLRGASKLLRNRRPVLLMEMISGHLDRAGSAAGEIMRELTEVGYTLFGLTPAGIRVVTDTVPSENVLALCRDVPRHQLLIDTLKNTRFPRNQTT